MTELSTGSSSGGPAEIAPAIPKAAKLPPAMVDAACRACKRKSNEDTLAMILTPCAFVSVLEDCCVAVVLFVEFNASHSEIVGRGQNTR